MKTFDILFECVAVYEDDEGNVLTEAAVRQWKRMGKAITKKYRCLAGPKTGKLVGHPGDCATRKDPKKVRHGRKVMRAKKGVIKKKASISKRTSLSRIVAKMNARLMGKEVKG